MKTPEVHALPLYTNTVVEVQKMSLFGSLNV